MDPADIRCETLPDPGPPDERGAVVRIERTAICGSDLHIYHGHLSPDGGYGIGHEAIGEVVYANRGRKEDFEQLLAVARESSVRSCTWVFAMDAPIWQFVERARGSRHTGLDNHLRMSE